MKFAHLLATALLAITLSCGADEKPCRAGHIVTSLPLADSCEAFAADVTAALDIAERRTSLTLMRDVSVGADALAFMDDETDGRTDAAGTRITLRRYGSAWLLGHELGHAVLQQAGRYEGHGPGGVDAEWDAELRAAERQDALTGASSL